MNKELFDIVKEDLKSYNDDYRNKGDIKDFNEQKLIEERLKEIFPDHDLQVLLEDQTSSRSFFRWYQPDLGIKLALDNVSYSPKRKISIVGKGHGASRTVTIDRPADVYCCDGFPSFYEMADNG